MLSLKIHDIKSFMNQLLLGDTFDNFETTEVSITTFNTFSIDGKIKKEFFDNIDTISSEETLPEYSSWEQLKPYCYQMIRGKRTPVSFKIIFQLSQKEKEKLLKPVHCTEELTLSSGLFLNIQYKNRTLLCTTGIGFKAFFPDSRLKQIWDGAVLDFFHSRNILFEQL